MSDEMPMMTILELPQTDEAKKKEKVNCLQDVFIDLLDERNIQLSEVQKATGIAWGTLHAWYVGDVQAQIADKNLLRLAQFFNVRLEYLIYGIGDDSPAFNKEESA